MGGKGFFDKVYGVEGADETRALYDDWADSYEDDVAEQGYATPMRLARALAAQSHDLSRPILDFGCGTGLSGGALVQAGFTAIDGADLSPEMLAKAREKEIYRDLRMIEADGPLPFAPGDYAAVAAIGVIGSGAAPIAVFDRIMDTLGPGCLFGFSFNDHTLAEPEYEARVTAAVDGGQAKLLVSEYGDHLPGLNMKSRIYVLEKK